MALPTGDRIAFTLAQASEATGVPQVVIATAIREGKLATHRAGANQIILRADLEKFVAGLPAPPKASPPVDMRKTAGYAQGRAIALRHLGKKA